jgi:predicted MFS family arabinose efflux permease
MMSRVHPRPRPPRPARDLRLLFAVQALRATLYGFGSVLIGSALAGSGLSDLEVTWVFAAMLVGFALASIVVGTRGDRWGRRRTYAILLVVLAASGTVYALSTSLTILMLAALTGTISVEANESGPITSLEQAMIPQVTTSTQHRTRAFARYNAVAYVAGSIGALAAGGPDFFRRFFPALPASQRFLLAYPAIGLAAALLATRLSTAVEAGEELTTSRRFPLVRSKRRVAGLSGLFALDSFGGGFVVGAFLVFWFQRRFGASTELLGVVFFAAGLLQAGSSLAAGWLANRIGMLNTMVYTHLPSNVLLILVPFMPTLPWAIAMLLLRFTISQMDVPARQAYVASVVDPSERTAAAAYTNTARYVVRPFGQALGGLSIEAIGLAAPLVIGGAIKIVYDITLLATFGHVGLRDDEVATPRSE